MPAVRSSAWYSLLAVAVGGGGDDVGTRVGDYHVVLVVGAADARCLDAPVDGEAHARFDDGGARRLDPRRPPVKPETVSPRPAHHLPQWATTAGIRGGVEHLLAAPGDGAERLAGSQQLGARAHAVSDGVEDLLLLLLGRSPDDP